MNRAEFRKQVQESAGSVEESLRKTPDDAFVQGLAAYVLDLGADASPALRRAARAFEGRKESNPRLFRFLVEQWNRLGQAHYSGRELAVIAGWLIRHSRRADEIGELPYGVGNWNGSWMQVGAAAADACEILAAEALRRDPKNEAALLLYAQEDFRGSVNRSRKGKKKILGPPVPPPSSDERAARIADILRQYVADVHPLEIPSLETIAVDSPDVVEALIRGIDCPAWRGGLRCIEALGRASVELPRVRDVFAGLLASGNQRTVDEVAMAVHYGLKGEGVELLSALQKRARRLIAGLSEKNASDYRHQWALRTILGLVPFARSEARDGVRSFIDQLLQDIAAMPAWKKERLFEFANEAPALLRKRSSSRPGE